MRKALRDAFADQFLVSGGNFLTVAICAWQLPPGEQGKLGYILAFYLATLVFNVPLIFQYASVRKPQIESPESYEGALAVLQIVAGVVLGGAIVIALYLLSGLIRWHPSQSELIGLAAFLFSQQLADYVRRSAYIFRSERVAVLCSGANYPVRVFVLVLLTPESVREVLWWLTVSTSVPVLMFAHRLWSLRRRLPNRSDLVDTLRQHLVKSRELVLVGPMIWLWNNVSTFVLGAITGLEAVGVLISVRSIANIVNVFLEMLETFVAARLGMLAAMGTPEVVGGYARKIQVAGVVVWLCGLGLFLVAGRQITTIVLGPSFDQYGDLLIILWILMGLIFLFRLGAVYYRTAGQTRALLLGALSAVVAVLVSAPLLIPLWGVYGAAWTLVLGAGTNYVTQRVIASQLRLR